MDDKLKQNLSATHIWLRLLYMLMFTVVLYCSSIVFSLACIAQFLFVLVGGERNISVSRFADVLCQYIAQALKFVSFVSEEKPFPFAELPESKIEQEDHIDTDVSDSDTHTEPSQR